MKVVCRESCFYSQGLQRFDEGKTYEMNHEQLKDIHTADMGKYFTDEQGNSLAKMKAPETTKTAVKEK